MNFRLRESDVEGARRGKDMTVPDQSYTVKELLIKHAQGIDPLVSRGGVFDTEDMGHDDPDFEKVSTMDLSDRQEIVEQAQSVVSSFRREKKERAKARAQASVSEARPERRDNSEHDRGREAASGSERDPGRGREGLPLERSGGPDVPHRGTR